MKIGFTEVWEEVSEGVIHDFIVEKKIKKENLSRSVCLQS